MAPLTPMMKQYMEIKAQYKDCILFYRLGDFYEMFFEDALTASKELEITLTGKDCGQEERAPMCGVPYHAVDAYLNKLISKGYKVAICEQVEDPKAAKGIVKRKVIRIVTPGTNLNIQALDETKNNYLMCIVYFGDNFGLSIVDVSTGDYYVTEVDNAKKLIDEITKYSPAEIIHNDYFLMSGVDLEEIGHRLGISVSVLDKWYTDEDMCIEKLKKHFHVSVLDGLGIKDYPVGLIAAGALLQYLYETQKNALTHLTHLTPYNSGKYMIIDSATRRNLELLETLREKQKRGSLLWVLDKTKTAMGARLLRTFIEQPYVDCQSIENRLDAVEELSNHMITREELREYLNPIYDLERLISRISYKSANPRDLIAFKNSLSMIPHIKYLMQSFESAELAKTCDRIDTLEDICSLIEASINDDPPISIKDGGIIKEGFNEDIDKYRGAKTEGKQWLSQLEARERENTGIKNLKIKYNKVFGYYLEVTNSYKTLVPENWTRRQTLANAERYITPELKELEDVILGAEDKLFSLEYDLFSSIRDKIAGEVLRIQQTAKALAKIDVYASLAHVASANGYVRPKINTKGRIDIKGGRHPVVEQMTGDSFIENDTYLDSDKHKMAIITGPNMAGKSTYMRQTALIVLMAQIGSFVPAASADIGIVDRIFTRVGASDDLASGQSTFMVEMTEVANILRNATKNSLVVLDEIGRGTSTFDGLSIAWAVVEYISNPKLIGAKTLFATHYHELTELEGKLDSVHNYCIAVSEQGDDIIFLRKIIKGGADKSYGIQVAQLAGVPKAVIERAKDLVEELSNADISYRAKSIETADLKPSVSKKATVDDGQYSLFDTPRPEPSSKPTVITQVQNDVLKEITDMDISNMTPMDALNALFAMQKALKAKDV